MSCKYYTFKDGDYHCIKQQKDVSSDIYYKYCRNYDYDDCPVYKQESSSGCFLTSACTAARGLPDDCHELRTLRNYRDNWLKQQPDGIELIARYYVIAPKIVEAIDARANRLEIFDKIYREMVIPCVELIRHSKFNEALELYRRYTLTLEQSYS